MEPANEWMMDDNSPHRWVQLAVSDGHFLDEITAALYDAKIDARLTEPVDRSLVGPVRTRFGAQASPAAMVIEVRPEALAEAQSVLRAIYDGAEEAATRESGAPAPTEEERAEDARWLAERTRRGARATVAHRVISRGLAGLFVLALLAGLIAIVFSVVRSAGAGVEVP